MIATWFVFTNICNKCLSCFSWCIKELEDQVFDILSLWAAFFTGNMEHEIKQTGDLTSKIW